MSKYIHATINFSLLRHHRIFEIREDACDYKKRCTSTSDEFNTALAVLPNLLIHDNTQSALYIIYDLGAEKVLNQIADQLYTERRYGSGL
ncbi:hypothetical protein E4U48_008292 [Claviceps purpurea]|nr:hypothetical protein E4U48_008292 [Claviceps purpurea]